MVPIFEGGERLFQPTLTDKAPGANYICPDVDDHGLSLRVTSTAVLGGLQLPTSRLAR